MKNVSPESVELIVQHVLSPKAAVARQSTERELRLTFFDHFKEYSGEFIMWVTTSMFLAYYVSD